MFALVDREMICNKNTELPILPDAGHLFFPFLTSRPLPPSSFLLYLFFSEEHKLIRMCYVTLSFTLLSVRIRV